MTKKIIMFDTWLEMKEHDYHHAKHDRDKATATRLYTDHVDH